MDFKNKNGFTLIELLMVIAITSILLGSAVPAFSDLINRNKIIAKVTHLNGTLQMGRKIAIESNQKVTLCPSDDGLNCEKDWSKGYIMFVDSNNNRSLDDDEQHLITSTIDDENIKLRWRAFGIRSSFQWHQNGITNHQNGYFELCYEDKPKLGRALIISKSGRIRRSADSDGNGIHENTSGKDISC